MDVTLSTHTHTRYFRRRPQHDTNDDEKAGIDEPAASKEGISPEWRTHTLNSSAFTCLKISKFDLLKERNGYKVTSRDVSVSSKDYPVGKVGEKVEVAGESVRNAKTPLPLTLKVRFVYIDSSSSCSVSISWQWKSFLEKTKKKFKVIGQKFEPRSHFW